MRQIYGKKSRSALSLVLIVSLGIHVAGLFIFGAVKVVQSLTREEQTFEAPPVEPMPEIEPEPQVNLEQRNQQSAPPRPNPITVDRPMDIDLPALNIDVNVETTSAYGRGSGGFGSGTGTGAIREMSLDLSNFGYSSYVDNTLEGTLFDFKNDDDGDPTGMEPHSGMREVSSDFVRSFNVSALKRKFFTADKNLYASYFIIPFQDARSAPEAFDAADIIEPRMIGAVYQGEFTPRKSGRFRFYGRGDDILIVRVKNRIVLDGSWALNAYSDEDVDESNGDNFGQNYFGFPQNKPGVYGDWFNLTAGEKTEVEIFICEVPGGRFGAWLTIEEANSDQGPKIFHTRELSKEDREFLLNIHPDSAKFMP